MAKHMTGADDQDSARILSINGKRFAAGLYWWPLQEGSSRKKLISEFAAKENQNMVVVHETPGGAMAGFANAPSGQSKLYDGAWSLAAVLSSILGDSWIGVFDLGDGNNVMIAVHEGAVVPGCDIVGDSPTIQARFEEMSHFFEWKQVYVADEVLSSQFDPELINTVTLEELLTDKKYDRTYRLRSIERNIDPKFLLIGVALILAVGGYYGWNMYKEKARQAQIKQAQVQAQAQRAARESQKREEALAQVQSQIIQPSWYNAPPASEVLKRCSQSFDTLPLTIAGWTLSSAHCNGTRLEANYERFAATTIMDFHMQANRLREQGLFSAVNAMPDMGAVIIDLGSYEPRGEEDVIDDDVWTRGWVAHFQALSINSSLKNIPHPAPPVPEKSIVDLLGPEKAVPPPPWWLKHEWEFSSEYMRPEKVLAAVPAAGMVVKSIQLKVDAGDWQWTAKGEVHVR